MSKLTLIFRHSGSDGAGPWIAIRSDPPYSRSQLRSLRLHALMCLCTTARDLIECVNPPPLLSSLSPTSRARATKLTELVIPFFSFSFSLEQSTAVYSTDQQAGPPSGDPDDAKSENPSPAQNFASHNTDDRSSDSASLIPTEVDVPNSVTSLTGMWLSVDPRTDTKKTRV